MKATTNQVILDVEEPRQGLIYLPTKKAEYATVVAAGPKAYDIEVGMRVFFHYGAGCEIEVDRKKYRVVRDSEVYCAVEV